MSPYEDFAHTGPGTLAGRFMRTFWQPVYEAGKLAAGRAVPIRVMSEDFTLSRGENGQPQVVAARGPKARIRNSPVREYLGLVFAYFGGQEPPELPRYTDFEAEGVLETSSYARACNFFNNVENQCDPVHVAFVHRTSPFSEAGLIGVPRVTAEETDYGIELRAERATGVRVSSLLMPTLINLKGSPEDAGEGGWRDTLAWRVPIDDESHHSFNVSLTHLSGEAAARYRARKASAPDLSSEAEELSAKWLRGELHVTDIKEHAAIVNIQDNVAQIGQGRIADRSNERLGKSDAGVILLRKIWERELRALAEGRLLKQWRAPERVATTAGV